MSLKLASIWFTWTVASSWEGWPLRRYMQMAYTLHSEKKTLQILGFLSKTLWNIEASALICDSTIKNKQSFLVGSAACVTLCSLLKVHISPPYIIDRTFRQNFAAQFSYLSVQERVQTEVRRSIEFKKNHRKLCVFLVVRVRSTVYFRTYHCHWESFGSAYEINARSTTHKGSYSGAGDSSYWQSASFVKVRSARVSTCRPKIKDLSCVDCLFANFESQKSFKTFHRIFYWFGSRTFYSFLVMFDATNTKAVDSFIFILQDLLKRRLFLWLRKQTRSSRNTVRHSVRADFYDRFGKGEFIPSKSAIRLNALFSNSCRAHSIWVFIFY